MVSLLPTWACAIGARAAFGEGPAPLAVELARKMLKTTIVQVTILRDILPTALVDILSLPFLLTCFHQLWYITTNLNRSNHTFSAARRRKSVR